MPEEADPPAVCLGNGVRVTTEAQDRAARMRAAEDPVLKAAAFSACAKERRKLKLYPQVCLCKRAAGLPCAGIVREVEAPVASGDQSTRRGKMTVLDFKRGIIAREVEITRLRNALEDALAWHEEEDKALSKQPPGGDRPWRRMRHGEQMDLLRHALNPEPVDAQ